MTARGEGATPDERQAIQLFSEGVPKFDANLVVVEQSPQKQQQPASVCVKV
jgi:hypothetical protein